MPAFHENSRFEVNTVNNALKTVADRFGVRQETLDRQQGVEAETPTVFIVDDDPAVRETLRGILEAHHYATECFADGSAFLKSRFMGRRGCLLVDALMPTMGGIELVQYLKRHGIELPAIVMSGNSGLRMAVHAMKSGAVDFLEMPVASGQLLAVVQSALAEAETVFALADLRATAKARIASLTHRQREVLHLVLAGHPSKNIAYDLRISQRTVDNHRAAIAKKTCSRSLPGLIQTALWANGTATAPVLPHQ